MPYMSASVMLSGFGGVFGCSSIMLIALIIKFTGYKVNAQKLLCVGWTQSPPLSASGTGIDGANT